MVTYKVSLLPYPIQVGEDPVRTRTIIPNKKEMREYARNDISPYNISTVSSQSW